MARRRPRPLRFGVWWFVLGLAAAWFVQRLRGARAATAAASGRAPDRSAGGWAAVEPPGPEPEVRAPVVPMVEPEPVAVGEVGSPGEPAIEPVAVEEPAAPDEPAAGWVVPEPGGTCPASHPVKAKLKSKLYHLPGMFAYDRTNPDRCYADGSAAEADGLRRAKR